MMYSNKELIELEMDAIYGLVQNSRVTRLSKPEVSLVCAWSAESTLVAFGPSISASVAEAFVMADSYKPESAPQAVELFVNETLTRTGGGSGEGTSVRGGPLFLMRPGMKAPSTPYRVIQSDPGGLREAVSLKRPANWEPGEWQDLTSGLLGPWSMAINNRDEPISICHTSAYSDLAAEAGLWTRDDCRGRGIGPVTTLVWANEAYKTKKAVFYSTWADNLKSRSVARKLGLEGIGWKWEVS